MYKILAREQAEEFYEPNFIYSAVKILKNKRLSLSLSYEFCKTPSFINPQILSMSQPNLETNHKFLYPRNPFAKMPQLERIQSNPLPNGSFWIYGRHFCCEPPFQILNRVEVHRSRLLSLPPQSNKKPKWVHLEYHDESLPPE